MIKTLNEILDMKELPPVTLIYGQEEFLIEEAFHKITEKFLEGDANHYNYDEIDAADKGIDVNYILDLATSVPMLSGERIVAVNNFNELFKGRLDKKKHANAPIARYLLNPNPKAKLILLANEKSIDGAVKGQAAFKKAVSSAKYPYHILLEHHVCLEFPKVWENELPRFIIQRFESLKKNIDIDAAHMLLTRCNPDLRQIYNEIEKVDIFFKDKSAITSKDINTLVGSSRSYNIFELQKAVGQKKLNTAIYILNKMLSESRQEMLIITMLTRYFVTIWKLTDLKNEGLNKFQLAGKAGVSPAFIADYQNATNNYSQKELNNVFIVIADTDEELKTSSGDTLFLLQNMLIKIIG